MINKLIFGGIDSSDYNVFISGTDTFSAPERDVEYVSVAGRNGDLTIDNGRWKNITVTYPAFIPNTFENKIGEFRAEMMKKLGYQRLEDTYHPDEFRLGSFSDGLNPNNITAFHRFGEFALAFNCKPQRFLKSGEDPLFFIPVLVSSTTWASPYMPVNGEMKFTASKTMTVTLTTYDASGTQIASTQETWNAGVEQTKTFTDSEKFWRITMTGMTVTDESYVTVNGKTLFNGESITLNAAKLGRNFEIKNPTGYPTKPMIEFYGPSLPYMNIDNYSNGEQTEWFSLRSNQMSDGQKHGFLDCELQYLYDENRTNQTDKLIITTAHGRFGKSLVFPEFSGDTTKISAYDLTSPFEEGLSLVLIYPKWWKL